MSTTQAVARRGGRGGGGGGAAAAADDSAVQQANGQQQAPVEAQAPAQPAGLATRNPRPHPHSRYPVTNCGNRFWSVAQGLIFRGLIIYFITSFFRGRSAPQTAGTGGPNSPLTGAKPVISSSNLFTNGTVMVMNASLTHSLSPTDPSLLSTVTTRIFCAIYQSENNKQLIC
ncbi:unnamed protein product [Medioppia subpectinata]|uniref:Uncharacterized protein n=1 Tax=Medioppia subpectinata TaxID=1979941 RepID=A0A7R9KUA7_9ACAR|nr:unnamed protein product [Medioppia subpectinata]CAG2109972.1 unnamed protein product [Medioppia subpectinata]